MTGVRIKLDTTKIQKIAFFESITKAKLKDCIETENEILFIVSKGYFGKAIGKKGANIKLFQNKFKKKIVLLEFNHNPEVFAANILRPIQIKNITTQNDNDSKVINIVINSSQRAFPSKKVKKTKTLIKKYFPSIENVVIRV